MNNNRPSACLADLQIMGILNVTPDSFSDGGEYLAETEALMHAKGMVAEGAGIIDVGGESTRPNANPVAAHEELARVLPAIQAIRAAQLACQISIDTMKPTIAEAALAAGANIVNDVSAGEHEGMFEVVAKASAKMVLMHRSGDAKVMQQHTDYDDVVIDVRDYLLRRVDKAMAAGIAEADLIIDPGFGFGKTPEQNWRLLQQLEVFVDTGFEVLFGASRKSSLRLLCGSEDRAVLDQATAATSLIAQQKGATYVRVHNVSATHAACRIQDAVTQ